MRFFLFLSLLLAPLSASARVVISEIAWMGSANGSDNAANARAEWIELWNSAESPADISGWKLAAEDGTPSVTLAGAIPPHGYVLLEREETAVPSIPADLVYGTGHSKWALHNDGEILVLTDQAGVVVDRVVGYPGWPIGGDKGTKETPQRRGENDEWITAPPTPKASPTNPSPPPAPSESASIQKGLSEEEIGSVRTVPSPSEPQTDKERSAPLREETAATNTVVLAEPSISAEAAVPGRKGDMPYTSTAEDGISEAVSLKFSLNDAAMADGEVPEGAYSSEEGPRSVVEYFVSRTAEGAQAVSAYRIRFMWGAGALILLGILAVMSLKRTKTLADEYEIIEERED